MLKKVLLFSWVFVVATFAKAQLNVSLVGSLSYNQDLSDIWGYVAPNGTEYALVGVYNGLSVVSLANPANPTQVAFVPGANSIWRDIKTWGTFAYVTTDQGQDGLTVVDLSNLPNGVTYTNWTPTLTIGGTTNVYHRAHNIWIDENGYAYISGANVGNGGVMMLDVHTTPGTPIFVGAVDARYSHDCYTRGDTLWTADIYDGIFTAYNVTNKPNPVQMGSHPTPFAFTHNVWISDDGNTLFTTDEKPNAPIGVYDVSDLNNITELDQFRPLQTVGTGVIPHNVHVWDDYLLISYYTDGLIVVDASRPENVVEVGNFDTYISPSGGFNGAWGAYPFLPSGLVLISDINSGLYVFQPNYVRACWLEGSVIDASTNLPINNVSVSITNTITQTTTDLYGVYKTGLATAGSYSVTYSASGYLSEVKNVTLSNGQLTIQDVQLTPLIPINFSLQVVDKSTGQPIAGAKVEISNADYNFQFVTDNNGHDSDNIFTGNYTLVAGNWGYKTLLWDTLLSIVNNTLTLELETGYEDPFALDLGWLTTSTAQTGAWERGVPQGILDGTMGQITPDSDIANDAGDKCYVTDNSGTSAGSGDVDNGIVRLVSPSFDLSTYTNPYIAYNTWFVNVGGNGNPNDALIIQLYNGDSTITVETITTSNGAWNPQQLLRVKNFITPNATMRIFFETSDLQGSGHIVEAAVDNFMVFDSMTVATQTLENEALTLQALPNPFNQTVWIDYELMGSNGTLQIFSLSGQLLENQPLTNKKGQVELGQNLPAGAYFVRIFEKGRIGRVLKIVKN